MKKADDRYYSYMTRKQVAFEKSLNLFYIILMIATLVGAFVIAVISPNDTEMTFLGMAISEIAVFILRKRTIPLHEIQFSDLAPEPEVNLRSDVWLAVIGLGFLSFIGYLMMFVGVYNFINSLIHG